MFQIFLMLAVLILLPAPFSMADRILDTFDNDQSPENGSGVDAYWNPPPPTTFHPFLDTTKVHSGNAALRVEWQNKDIWPSFYIGNLDHPGNAGTSFFEADAVRMAIAGPAGRIILKLADAEGVGSGDLADVTIPNSDDYQVVEFPYFAGAANSLLNLENISEIQLLINAGTAGTSGTIWIDTIELIRGTGANAQVVARIDNFDNDSALADDPNAPDSTPSGYSLRPGPFVTSVVSDPSGANNHVLRVDYNTSPYNVLWVENLDVTDWSAADGITIDIYGTAGGILLKLKDADGREQEPTGGWHRHDGDQWDTHRWDFIEMTQVDMTRMGKLIVFVEGPAGGTGTIYFDNLTLTGPITNITDWPLR